MRRSFSRFAVPPEIKWAIVIGTVAHFSMAAAGMVLGLLVMCKAIFWVGGRVGPWYLLALLAAAIAAWLSLPSERAKLVEGWRAAQVQSAACESERATHPNSPLRDIKACLPPTNQGGR